MTTSKKVLHLLLALRESHDKTYKNCITDMLDKFQKKQTLFMGERKIHTAVDGYLQDPAKVSFKKVASTVAEQLEWLKDTILPGLNELFSIEKTNSSGKATAELMVEDKSWGTFSSLELLRLKSILENPILKKMYAEIPIRKESEIWKKSEDPLYRETAGIFQSELQEGDTRTTIKKKIIVDDPHVKDAPNRPPIVDELTETVKTGTYSVQFFSGESSVEERAYMLKRLDILHKAVIAALERANSIDAVESTLGNRIFDYIHTGKNE